MININGTPKDNYEYKLKQHHHVKLDSEFKLDCMIWLQFLKGEMSMICSRPMIDLKAELVNLKDIAFTSDASWKIGFGARMGCKWIQGFWDQQFLIDCEPSIEYLELFALCACILTWQDDKKLKDGRIQIWCDNVAVVHVVNDMSSKCEKCMKLLRILALKYNRRLSACFITTKDKYLSDALSRGQFECFHKLGPGMNQVQDKISHLV